MSGFAGIALSFLVCTLALAQDSTPKLQVFGGYSYTHMDTGGLTGQSVDSVLHQSSGTFGLDSNFNGWNGEGQYNWKPWLGMAADFGGRYGSPIIASDYALPKSNAYSFLFGPVLSHRFKAGMTPFLHVLFGWDRASLLASIHSGSTTYSDFGMAAGGGLDYKLSRGVAVRVLQVDYFYTGHNLNSLYGSAFGPGQFKGLANHENNLRISTGLVFRF